MAAVTDPVSDLQRLMAWARENGYRITGTVEIGYLKVQVIADLRQAVIDGDATPAVTYDSPERAFGLKGDDLVPTQGLDG